MSGGGAGGPGGGPMAPGGGGQGGWGGGGPPAYWGGTGGGGWGVSSWAPPPPPWAGGYGGGYYGQPPPPPQQQYASLDVGNDAYARYDNKAYVDPSSIEDLGGTIRVGNRTVSGRDNVVRIGKEPTPSRELSIGYGLFRVGRGYW